MENNYKQAIDELERYYSNSMQNWIQKISKWHESGLHDKEDISDAIDLMKRKMTEINEAYVSTQHDFAPGEINWARVKQTIKDLLENDKSAHFGHDIQYEINKFEEKYQLEKHNSIETPEKETEEQVVEKQSQNKEDQNKEKPFDNKTGQAAQTTVQSKDLSPAQKTPQQINERMHFLADELTSGNISPQESQKNTEQLIGLASYMNQKNLDLRKESDNISREIHKLEQADIIQELATTDVLYRNAIDRKDDKML